MAARQRCLSTVPIIAGDALGYWVGVDSERDLPWVVSYRGRELMAFADRHRALVFMRRMAEPVYG